jgi:hypothetical protein
MDHRGGLNIPARPSRDPALVGAIAKNNLRAADQAGCAISTGGYRGISPITFKPSPVSIQKHESMKQQTDPYKFAPGYYWFSFAGPRNDPRYTGPRGFLGVAIVYADSYDEGLSKTWAMNINPGGNVLGGLMNFQPDEKWCNRLLSRESIEAMEEEYSRGNN